MKIEIDEHSGFCFGVVRAITRAEEALAGGERVYSLGDIVHNRVEVQRLEQLGLRTVTHDDMERLDGRRLFIRAHGEPPSTYRRAERLGIEVIDATWPTNGWLRWAGRSSFSASGATPRWWDSPGRWTTGPS